MPRVMVSRPAQSCKKLHACSIHPQRHPADSDTLQIAPNVTQGLGKPLTLSTLRRHTQTRKREVCRDLPRSQGPRQCEGYAHRGTVITKVESTSRVNTS